MLYPTVGLQTPGEVVEANFGEAPFVFDFEGMLAVRHCYACINILNCTIPLGDATANPSLYRNLFHQ